MHQWADGVLVAIVLTSFVLVAASRLGSCIRIVALQGVLLGLLTVAAESAGSPRAAVLALATASLKGVVFPRLLARVLRDAEVRREVEPFVSHRLSLVLTTLMLAAALWFGAHLPRAVAAVSPLVVPVSFFTILVGLFIIVSRKKALTQVLGYLVLENGIYAFGVGMVERTPMLVELGVLLDLFVAVFVMGIAVFHIRREFNHIDTDQLTALRDWTA